MKERSGASSDLLPDRWLVLTVPAPPSGEEPLVADGFLRLGSRLLERVGDRVVAYLPPPDDLEAFLREAEAVLGTLSTAPGFELSWHWRRAGSSATETRPARPIRITERIIVAPPGVRAEERPGDLVLRIDAGIGFGDGSHGSTRGCLRLLERLVKRGERVLDVGAGSGILAVAAARLGAGAAVALEKDPFACRASRANAVRNRVADEVSVGRVDVDRERSALRRGGPYAGVAVNLETRLALSLLPELEGLLEPRGWLVLSGIGQQERTEILAETARRTLSLVGEEVDDGWWTGGFRKGRIPSRSRPAAPRQGRQR